ncbi:MerR family transcriptional regulator [Rhodococcus ruber]|uniref:MerR family transcriptional regulator n=1 Tax=Rhodococcus ruber TaxID=1830 RepID=UPI00265EBCEF|nr:MerR family transcriptional regulator [Rhodococcus ruber]MDO1479464.1 MerR family transcriptional regulator [Rhodococcus ruber]
MTTAPSATTVATIAEAAERTGLTTHTLRYYERDGLMLREIGRSSSGHRLYTEDDLAWVVLLTRLRATGMPIREIREYAALCRAGSGNEQDRLALLRAHRARVLTQLDQVTEHLAAIDGKIDIYRSRTSGLDDGPYESARA